MSILSPDKNLVAAGGGLPLVRRTPPVVSTSLYVDSSWPIMRNLKVNTRDSGIPEINGSPAGFIALVVVLAAIFLISCTGVFLLLRTHKPDPYERHARRTARREDFLHEMPLGPPDLKDKVRNLFRFGRRRDGWVRASSGEAADEWDASDPMARTVYDPLSETRLSGSRWGRESSVDSAQKKFGMHKSETMESIELVSAAPTLKDVALPQLAYDDPYRSFPTAEPHSEYSANMDDVLPAGGPRQSSRSPPNPPSVSSSRTRTEPMKGFQNGSHFRESL
jgi:hypothetical protein